MSAIVTRRHRELAFACVWSDTPCPSERKWIEDGENQSAAGLRLVRTAQALADIEAESVERVMREMSK